MGSDNFDLFDDDSEPSTEEARVSLNKERGEDQPTGRNAWRGELKGLKGTFEKASILTNQNSSLHRHFSPRPKSNY